jgi:hypothetical protein
MAIGEYLSDAIRDIKGHVSSPNYPAFFGPAGCFSGETESYLMLAGTVGTKLSCSWLNFDASLVVPTALENRPASVSVYVCIKY